MAQTVRDAATGTDRVVGGTAVRLPIPRFVKTDVADPVNLLTLRALTDACQGFAFSDGLVESAALTDGVATFVVVAGTTTQADVIGLIVGDAELADSIAATGIATTTKFDATFTAAAGDLWVDANAEASIQLILGADGRFYPSSGKLDLAVHTDAHGTPPDTQIAYGSTDGSTTAASVKPVKVASDGTVAISGAVTEYLPVAGADPTAVVGTTGRLNEDVTIQINAAGPKSVVAHPKQNGVSIIGANGAAASVSAAGKVVTLTAKNDGTTDVTAMNVLIAASSTVSPLLAALTGTGADTFEAAFTVAETPLWASGTIPAHVLCALGPDGYNWPVETDSTGGLKTSFSSLLFSEDGSRNIMRVEKQGTETGRSVASAIVVAAGTTGRIYGHVLEAGAGGATFNVRKDGVIVGAIIAQFILAANTYSMQAWPDWPFGNGLYCEIAAGGGAFNFVVRNT